MKNLWVCSLLLLAGCTREATTPVAGSGATNEGTVTVSSAAPQPAAASEKALPNWYVFKIREFRNVTHSADKKSSVIEGVTVGGKDFKIKMIWDESFHHSSLIDAWMKRKKADLEAGIPYIISGEVISRNPLTIQDDTMVEKGDSFGAPAENVF